MKKKKWLEIIIVVLIIALIVLLKSNISSDNQEEVLNVSDYFPQVEMTLEYSGGFENAGFTQIVDRIEGDKVQIKHIDTGAYLAMVYQVTDEYIKLIYAEEVSGEGFKENYLESFNPNRGQIILSEPLEVGFKWTVDDSQYEITGTNVEITTPAGTFNTIEVIQIRDEFEVKSYYAKELGLVKRIIEGYGVDELISVEYK